MQLLMGMSIRRYFPTTGTAGLERCRVRGNKRDPRPPPRIRARTERMGGLRSPTGNRPERVKAGPMRAYANTVPRPRIASSGGDASERDKEEHRRSESSSQEHILDNGLPALREPAVVAPPEFPDDEGGPPSPRAAHLRPP